MGDGGAHALTRVEEMEEAVKAATRLMEDADRTIQALQIRITAGENLIREAEPFMEFGRVRAEAAKDFQQAMFCHNWEQKAGLYLSMAVTSDG